MDIYPPELVTHEAPLLVISGLGGPKNYSESPTYPLIDNGPHVSSHAPPATDETAERLAEYFLKRDATGLWGVRQEKSSRSAHLPVFRIRLVGRDYFLAPRKANPPSSSGGPPARVLHSPVSPLSPDSPLYPDGVISHLWLRKHQSILPAVFASFYSLYTETNDGGIQSLEDNKIITSINRTKKHFLASSNSSLTSASAIGSEEMRSSGHRTKYVVVILTERSIMSSSHIDTRLTAIRRETNLSTNVTFFVLQSNVSPVEFEQFVSGLLVTLYPGALEYYRELSKHSRRKRNKGSIPPPTIPASRALSSQAWTLRYEFKLGVFAEFRQEMDVAARNYETAYEKLLAEVFETTSSWSERWTEARCLSDALTLRIIRCNLWLNNCTVAQQRWSYHMSRIRDILDRRGKGTETYGYAAWASRWNTCLVELLRLAKLPVFTTSTLSSTMIPGMLDSRLPAIYVRPEKATERLTPQEFLHHPGFYYYRAAEWIKVREERSKTINLDDGMNSYDTYLCPPPKEERLVDYITQRISLLTLAKIEFDLRQHTGMVNAILYQLASLKMVKAKDSPELWADALKDLQSIAPSYRKDGWWNLLEDILWKILECSRRGGDASSVVLTEFELMCNSVFTKRSDRKYDLSRCLDDLGISSVKPTIVAMAGDVVNILSVSYTFENTSVHAGQPVSSQIVIFSNAHTSSTPLVFSELKVTYEGGLKTILLRHVPRNSSSTVTTSDDIELLDLKSALHEFTHTLDDGQPAPAKSPSPKPFLVAETDLTFVPGKTKIYELSAVAHEMGTVKAVCGTFGMVTDRFEMDFIVMFGDNATAEAVHPLPSKGITQSTPVGGNGVWWAKDTNNLIKKRPVRGSPEALTILPRPPKMEVYLRGIEKGVYIDEMVKLGLEVVNGECEDVDVNVNVKILGWPLGEEPKIKWLANDGSDLKHSTSSYPLGKMNPSQRLIQYFRFPSCDTPADCTLEIKLQYRVLSDPETGSEKMVSVEMPIITPFHCTFDFSPRVHPDIWPNSFSLDAVPSILEAEDGKKPRGQGIIHRWCLTTNILGVGEDYIIIERCELPLQKVGGGVECEQLQTEKNPLQLEPSKTVKIQYILDIQKRTLEDRGPSTIDAAIIFHWHRASDSTTTTTATTIPVPRLFVPLREPRVLCESKSVTDAIDLTYTIENPTNYFLTFSVAMDDNPDFSFSGPKQPGLQLLPLSRVGIDFRIFPNIRNVWVRPHLKVVDRYFNKVLKTSPCGDGLGLDKMGLMLWIPDLTQSEGVDEKIPEETETKTAFIGNDGIGDHKGELVIEVDANEKVNLEETGEKT